MTTFTQSWDNGRRTPDTIQMPSGDEYQVQYMRDGNVLLIGTNATLTYKRHGDNSATFTVVDTLAQHLEMMRGIIERMKT